MTTETETETKYHFVSLCLVRSTMGGLHWVKAPSCTVSIGDLISFQPYYRGAPCIGTVEDWVTEDELGDTYHLIARSATIHEAQRIFSPTWEKEDTEDESV